MGNVFPRCTKCDCANNFEDIKTGKDVCRALTDNLLNPNTGVCPFFVGRKEARENQQRAEDRAAEAGYLVKGFYSSPLYVKSEFRDGKSVEVPDFERWLDSLYQRGIIDAERHRRGIAYARAM